MAARKDAIDFERENADILSRLDIIGEYKSLGVIFPSERVKSNGVCECFSIGREESNPSAGVSAESGRYFDLGSGEGYSLWDFAAKYGGRFTDWRDARKHYAEKAGISIGSKPSGGKSNSSEDDEDKLDAIRWLDWSVGRENIIKIWGKTLKKGISLDAIKIAGGRFGEFPIRRDKKTKEESGGEYKVVGIPGYDASKINLDRPSCWVIWNATGKGFTRYRGPNAPPETLKMRSVGPTRGTLMNRQAVEILSSGKRPELIIKSGGPTDMLAILTVIPPEWLNRIAVVTNASGEVGEVTKDQQEIFGDVPTIAIGDRDLAGSTGAIKWLQSLAGSRRAAVLPYAMQPKHGKDARDFLAGVRE